MHYTSGNLQQATSESIEKAAALLRNGRLVAFPTETVYGLGADAFNPAAIDKIYEAKGRPADNPLIAHVSSEAMLSSVVQEFPTAARLLMDAFWPGPLTLVLKRAAGVPPVVCAGLDTVAVRQPEHPVALHLIRSLGGPIAAPSANRSGRPSPTQASHVLADLGDSVDLILDGGSCRLGLESTVLDLTGPQPILLRSGGIPAKDIENVLNDSLLRGPVDDVARSPGLKHRHYSPSCRLVLVPAQGWPAALAAASQDRAAGVLCRSPLPIEENQLAFYRRVEGDAAAYGHALFAGLRDAEAAGVDVLYAEEIEETGLGLAVMDRLRRAASGLPEAVNASASGDSNPDRERP